VTATIKAPSRLSYSSVSTYAECSMRWLLERGHKLSSSTWWATLAGSAIHELTERYDRALIGVDEVDDIKAFEKILTSAETFELTLAKYEAQTAERGEEVKASGRVLKEHGKTGGPNKKDRDWWLVEGPAMVESYITWRKLTRWEILTLWDGSPAIELQIDEPVAGRKFLGFIDRIFVRPSGEVVIVDIKSGKEPSSRLQLATYRLGVLRKYGLDITTGAYWMAGKGDIAGLVDLEQFDLDRVEHMVEMSWRGIEAGVFLPHVSNMCSGCGVRDFCPGVGGRKAGELPVIETVEVRQPDVAQTTLS